MSRHTEIQNLFYDYLHDQLELSYRSSVENHLALCEKCSLELKRVRSLMMAMDEIQQTPSDERSPEFWNTFALSVEQKIRNSGEGNSGIKVSLWDSIRTFIDFHPRLVTAMSSGFAVAVVGMIILWRGYLHVDRQSQFSEQIVENGDSVVQSDNRMAQYFRKSKTLLVGITNMKTDDEQQLDLTAERRTSRALVQEARYLKNQPLDERSAKLMGDLEKILIELANIKEQGGLSNVEMIRGGIHQENLLFKIRMAEARYDSTRYIPINHLN